MKTIKTLFAVMSIISIVCTAQAVPEVIVWPFIVPAPTSTNNNNAIQNVMEYVAKGGVVGLIPTNFKEDPRALNRPNLLRVSEINFSPVGLKMWDSEANPTGAFANENGSRLAWVVDWKDSTPFLASDVNFRSWSSDTANTLGYVGNFGVNTANGQPLTFSPSLRGELWDANGNVIANYHNGEAIAGRPINRLIAIVRIGYYATSMNDVGLNVTYFRNNMSFTNFVAFYTASVGSTNQLTSRPHLTAYHANTNGDRLVMVEGQRRMGMVYSLRETYPVIAPPEDVIWRTVMSNLSDGGSYTNATFPTNVYYKVFEGGIVQLSPSKLAMVSSVNVVNVPMVSVVNGPE